MAKFAAAQGGIIISSRLLQPFNFENYYYGEQPPKSADPLLFKVGGVSNGKKRLLSLDNNNNNNRPATAAASASSSSGINHPAGFERRRRRTSVASTPHGKKKQSSSSSERIFKQGPEEREVEEEGESLKISGGGSGDYDDDYNDDDDDLSSFRGLVLDVSYRPVNVVCWKRAICLEFMEKADVLEYYDQTVCSTHGSFYIPAVLRVPNLLQIVKRRRVKHSVSRKNIYYRDSYACQYCSSTEDLTIDHVLPVSRGGQRTWENLVTACSRCNSRKGQKTLEAANMKLLKIPKAPKDFDIIAIPLTIAAVNMLRKRKGVPGEWMQYLSKPTP